MKEYPYPFQQLAPTPARGKFDEALYVDDDWWAEEKYDGDRRIAQFLSKTRFTGRRISEVDGLYVEKTDNLPHLNKCVPALVGTVLDGEIICPWPGARSKDVTSIMGSLPERALALQKERGFVQYRVFDCLFFKGTDIREKPLWLRRKRMLEALDIWSNEHARKVIRVYNEKPAYLKKVWARGGEGLILKHREMQYHEEKKWVKVKQVETHDVVIMGYEEAKKTSTKVTGEESATKYAQKGWIGAVVFGQYLKGKLVECGKCSGMDDALREQLSKEKKKHLGRVVEILAQSREPTGKFRHPRWVKFRDDKNPKDCKMEMA